MARGTPVAVGRNDDNIPKRLQGPLERQQSGCLNSIVVRYQYIHFTGKRGAPRAPLSLIYLTTNCPTMPASLWPGTSHSNA